MLSHLRKKRRVSPLALTGVLLTLLFVIIAQYDPPLLHELRLKYFDFFLRNNPAPLSDSQIIIIDIDSESLEKIGRWPWPRKRLAELLTKVAAGGPAVIGLDIILAEPDNSSPHILGRLDNMHNIAPAIQQYLHNLPNYDLALAQTLKKSPAPVVLGYVFTNTIKKKSADSRQVPRNVNMLFYGQNPLPFLYLFNEVDPSLEIFERTAQGIGFLNVIPDQDSIIRNLPLLVNYRDDIYPGLILSMLLAATHEDTIEVETDQNGIRALQIGEYSIPTNMHGELIINFSGPSRTLPYISAYDILSGQVTPALFQNSYVLIGTSAPGLFDLRAVPTDRALPGVELHGHALNTILSKNYLHRPEWAKGAELISICCICLLLLFLLSRMKAANGALLVFFLSVGMFSSSLWCLYHYHLLLDIVYPLTATWLMFGILTFYNFIAGERKIRRIRSAFSHYLSPQVVKELLKKQNDLVLDGEERELSILFSDIRQFTAMAEKMSPDDLCAFLNEYLTPMTKAIMQRRGTVDKFIGDAIMAFWNAPLYTPNHLKHACDCALAMIYQLNNLNKSWSKRGLPEVRIGIGIHCGVARVGNMGSQQRFDYTVMGDSVNLASRLEGLTRLYDVDILVSDAVYAMLKESDFFFRRVDTVRAAGKTTPVTLYQLIEIREEQMVAHLQEMEAYYAALELYNDGEFFQAAQSFHTLKEEYPNVYLYKLYSKRCLQMLKDPPKHWNGITNIQLKKC
jgi:adenylate cyclase